MVLVTGHMDFTTYEGCYLNKAMTLIQLGNKNPELRLADMLHKYKNMKAMFVNVCYGSFFSLI